MKKSTPSVGWLAGLWLLALLLGPWPAAQAQTFAHPSIPFTNADLTLLKANITRQPWLAGYQALQADYHSQLGYTSPGATATVSRVPNLNNVLWRSEMVAVHNLTFMYVFTGNAAYARKATDILDNWAVVNTSWGGGENLLDIGDMAPFFVPAADILRGTYPGWTAANTQHVQAYFRNVLLPSAGIDFTLRDNNKGALQLQTALGIAAFLDDASLFQKAVEQYRIDAGAGLRCSLPNGEVGDTGRDAHWFVQIQALAWSAEVIYKQGIDVYADLNNRLLAIGELYNQYSIAPATVGPFIPFGGYAAYWQNWGIGPGARPQSPFHSIIQSAYTLRKGIPTPYTTQMQGLVGEGSWSFLYRKSADASTATALPPLVFPATAAATRLSRVEIGNTGIAGSASYDAATGKWTLQGAGNSLEGNLSFVGQPVHGDAAMVVKVESDAKAAVEVGLMLRSTLDASTNYMAVRLYGGGGVVPTSKGASFGTSYSHGPPISPWWLKLERVGNRLFCYHSPDGVHWTNNSQTVFPAGALPADAYLGMYTMSNNLSQLNPAVLSHVAITNTAPAGAPVITSALAASGQLNTAFSYATAATNSPTSFSATGLPAGLSLNPATGVILGTPTTAGAAAVIVTATNARGASSAIVVLSVSSNAAPSAPVATAAVSNSVNIRVGWAAVPNATSYSVKHSLAATGPFTTLQTGITGLYFIDTTPTPEVPNYYVVTALAGALESGNSNVVSASVPPAVPAKPVVTNLPTQINLSWPAANGAVRYNVKRSLAMGGPYTTVGSPTTTSYADLSVVPGTGYYYVVSAVGSRLESANSPEAFGVAGATARTWSPTPVDSFFNQAANWAENAVPQSPAILNFGASTDTLLTNNVANLAVARLEFTSAAPAYVIGGNALTLQDDIVSSSPRLQSLTMPLVLSTPIEVNMTGPAAFTGLISGPGSLTKDGLGQLDIIGVNTYSGNTIVRGGGSGGIRMGGVGTGTPSAPTAGPLGTGRIILQGGSLTGGVGHPTTLYNDIEIPAGFTSYMYGGYDNGGITLRGKLLGGGTFITDMNNYDGINLYGDNSGFTGAFVSRLRSGNYRVRFSTAQSGSAKAVWILDASGVDCHGINFGTGTIEFGELGGRGYLRNDAGGSPTIRVGALNHNSAFGGTLQNYINIEKVGTGSFQMTGLQNSGGTTTVKAGKFMLDNDPVSGTFISPIVVQAGTFSGRGRSTAPVTVGTGSGAGATLDPGTSDTRISPTPVGTFLTTSLLTLNADATYHLDVDLSLGTSDKMTVGSVVLNNPTLLPSVYAAGTPAAGTNFLLIDNTGNWAVTGTFNSLPELAAVTVGGLTYRITYRGGTGNDVVLLSSQSPLSTAAASLNQQVELYPNPAQGTVTLRLPASLQHESLRATVLNTLGQVVLRQVLPAGAAQHLLPLTGLAAGVYSVQLETSAGLVTKRLIYR